MVAGTGGEGEHLEATIQRYLQEPETFQLFVKSAMAGDPEVLPQVREILNAAPDFAKELGDLTKQTEDQLLDAHCGNNLLKKEATRRELTERKQRLADSFYVEELLKEQITLDWQMLVYARKRAQERGDQHSDKLLSSAHRRFLASMKCLEQIRRLAPPVRINIAENQVNMN